MTTRKTAKKAAAKKSSAKKKSATNKTAKTAKKAATKKVTAKKAVKKAAKKVVAKKTSTSKKTASKKQVAKKVRASDLIKRPSHTPAVFKPSNQRPSTILFTLEEVREVLKKRAEEAKKKREENEADSTVPSEKPTAQKKASEKKQSAPEKPYGKHAAASLDDILGLTPSPVGSTHVPRSEADVPREFRKYYRLLMELRREVGEELNLHSNDTLKRSQKEDAGDISISVDAGTDNFDRDFALSLLSSEQEALKEIEAAIERVHKGTYGVCEITGEKIDAERLEAVPFTRFSLEGQKQWEASGGRKKVSRQGTMLNDGTGETITFGDDDAES
jgi:DnaK suppressor protein